MPNKAPVFSQIVKGATVGRGPVFDANGNHVAGSHKGVDLAVPGGTPVKPLGNGVVVNVDFREDYGNYIVVRYDLPDGKVIMSLQAHLQERSTLTAGDKVTSDTVLGLSGNTGRVYGAGGGYHVHMEMVEVKPDQAMVTKDAIEPFFSYKILDPKANPYGMMDWDPSKISRENLTKLERLDQIKLTDSEFESYKSTLASVETKGKSLDESYVTTSKSGAYLGRYQFGDLALQEAGFKDKTGNWTALAKANGVDSNESFLANPSAQDKALRLLTDKNAEFIVKNDLDTYIGDQIGGAPVTAAGLMLGAHNNRTNLDYYIKTEGELNQGDGNGFAIGNYVALGDKVQNATPVVSIKAPTGHWEDSTQYDALGNVLVPGERVWIADKPIPKDLRDNANDPRRLDRPTDGTATKPPPPQHPRHRRIHSPRRPSQPQRRATDHPHGDRQIRRSHQLYQQQRGRRDLHRHARAVSQPRP
jgi:Peptidase family M23